MGNDWSFGVSSVQSSTPESTEDFSAGVPAPGIYAGVFGKPANNPFVSERPRADAFASRDSFASRKDLFASRDTGRTHQAFSMAPPASRPDGVSPPLGSVFSTRKSGATSVLPGPAVSPAAAAFDRGLELLEHKDHERALAAWQEAVALDPGNRTYQANLKRLERLAGSTG